MALLTFKIGGVHPPENKRYTAGLPIEILKAPKQLVFPLSQHIGAPCKPIVEPGQRVLVNTKIGEPTAFVSSPIHSSVSGKVLELKNYPMPNGRMVSCVVIENDGKDEKEECTTLSVSESVQEGDCVEDAGYLERSPEVLRDRIKDAGLVGMGGATFPTFVKLSPPKEKPIDTVIINGAECEPYLTADDRLMVEAPNEVVEGLRVIMKVVGVTKGYIGIEANKEDAIKQMSRVCESVENVEVVVLKVQYPQGAEKMLIKAITDREVPAGGLPMDVQVVVQNVGTAFASYEAARFGRPLVERIVTVTGAGIKNPKNVRARIGTPIKDLIEFCGGMNRGVNKIISGGPMMGFAFYNLDTPVTKGTSGVLALLDKGLSHYDEYKPCIRCGRCIEACPMGLMPLMLSVYSEKAVYDECKEYNLYDCFECGCCTYVCPSKRPIVQQIRLAKGLAKR